MRTAITVILGVLICAVAQATPPGDLNVSYDLEKGTLTVQGAHPSEDVNDHYVRRLEVSVNNGEVKKYYFHRQSSAPEFNETVPLALKPKDEVLLKVYCSNGGTQQAEMHIPEEEGAQEEKIDLKALKDRDHKNVQVIP